MNDTAHDVADELQRSHPAPAAITLSSEHRAGIARRVEVAIDRRDARSRIAIGIAAPATVLACAVAVTAVAVLALTGGTPVAPTADRPVLASSAATRVLERAAERALATPSQAVREDQFVYTRSAAITNEGSLGGAVVLGPVHERETWLGQDPGPFGWQDDVIREHGQDWPIESGGASVAGPTRPTYAWLDALPTDPDALLDTLARSASPVDGQTQDQAVFDLIGTLVLEQLVPPRTAAALYRAATRIPGVDVDRRATDALGRAGIGISRADERFGTRTTWVLDESTSTLLGARWYVTHADGSPDTLFGATAVLETAVVDTAGVAPGSAA
ncbi:hypothetical protein F4692_002421 [Nocardioides cavernae]|uniref:CU044_5270 family protein n=1 Tax=Nocardioides cavernae TaxID=1921566 RepID=A0A7Y9KTW1_9ACTN|nr:CU044_5270 family protein [Nocardioides cavernae]NYE37288.1 hypothetical protein [Nocardioides cavernae]